jgi:hypothetical protein
MKSRLAIEQIRTERAKMETERADMKLRLEEAASAQATTQRRVETLSEDKTRLVYEVSSLTTSRATHAASRDLPRPPLDSRARL